ncbi:MAG TPA: hypothetical protein VF070_13195 [Streptosporangiaceae bacterium]
MNEAATQTTRPDRPGGQNEGTLMDHMNPRASVAGMEYLREAFTKLLDAIDARPGAVEDLDDNVLLAAHAWTEGSNPNIAGECRRRRQHHEQQARRFADHEDTELVPVLAERARP